MITSLHVLARLATLAFAGLSLAALTAARMQPLPEGPAAAAAANPWEALTAEVRNGRRPVDLLHREDGRLRRLNVPDAERWDFLTMAPRMGADGSMEAVGRFATRAGDAGPSGEGAVGLVRVRLPEAEVLERVELDVMPTGRVAWDPARADHVVFPGSSGRLYSYRFLADPAAETVRGGSAVLPLDWRCEAPGGRVPFVVDPVWPAVPELRGLLIVSLARLRRTNEPGKALPMAPWWVELGDDGEAIVAAGPLFDDAELDGYDPKTRMRHPNVAARDGRLQLIYLLHTPGAEQAVPYSADLEISTETGRPRVRPGSAAPVGGAILAAGALVPSLDGRSAFVASQGTDRILRLPLDSRPTASPTPATRLDLARIAD